MSKAFLEMLSRRLLRARDSFDYVVPFPGHDGEYSETLQFTEVLIDEATPINYNHLLARDGEITAQKELSSKEERWDNATGSITVRAKADGASVLILDDICTSGASLCDAAHAVRQAGAEDVLGVVYGLNTGWGSITEIYGPGATITDIRHIGPEGFE